MRRRTLLYALAAVLCSTGGARAGWSEFWHRFHLDWHRSVCWPEPFQDEDRQLAVSPLISMTDRGWRLQNTLSDHFFDTENQVLTRSGQMKVHWIATQAPMHRRSVFVLRGNDAETTQARVASVQQFLLKCLPEGPRPEVLLSDVVPTGGSGEYFDQVDRQLKSSIPPPRLPPAQGTEGGSN